MGNRRPPHPSVRVRVRCTSSSASGLLPIVPSVPSDRTRVDPVGERERSRVRRWMGRRKVPRREFLLCQGRSWCLCARGTHPEDTTVSEAELQARTPHRCRNRTFRAWVIRMRDPRRRWPRKACSHDGCDVPFPNPADAYHPARRCRFDRLRNAPVSDTRRRLVRGRGRCSFDDHPRRWYAADGASTVLVRWRCFLFLLHASRTLESDVQDQSGCLLSNLHRRGRRGSHARTCVRLDPPFATRFDRTVGIARPEGSPSAPPSDPSVPYRIDRLPPPRSVTTRLDRIRLPLLLPPGTSPPSSECNLEVNPTFGRDVDRQIAIGIRDDGRDERRLEEEDSGDGAWEQGGRWRVRKDG